MKRNWKEDKNHAMFATDIGVIPCIVRRLKGNCYKGIDKKHLVENMTIFLLVYNSVLTYINSRFIYTEHMGYSLA